MNPPFIFVQSKAAGATLKRLFPRVVSAMQQRMLADIEVSLCIKANQTPMDPDYRLRVGLEWRRPSQQLSGTPIKRSCFCCSGFQVKHQGNFAVEI
jgi:hypothetical protein